MGTDHSHETQGRNGDWDSVSGHNHSFEQRVEDNGTKRQCVATQEQRNYEMVEATGQPRRSQ